MVEGVPPTGMAESAWIKVAGVFRSKELGGQKVPVLSDVVISAANEPEQPYLF